MPQKRRLIKIKPSRLYCDNHCEIRSEKDYSVMPRICVYVLRCCHMFLSCQMDEIGVEESDGIIPSDIMFFEFHF